MRRTDVLRPASPTNVPKALAHSAILVVGSPRSGTTWLAKIIDSHPDVLYRHEPDEVCAPHPDLEPANQLLEWLAERRLATAGPPPFFRKSWRPASVATVRTALAGGLKYASRLPGAASAGTKLVLPDMMTMRRNATVHALIKLVNWSAAQTARSLPDTRTLFILRHPCGQVASSLAGVANHLWTSSAQGEIPHDLRAAAACAAEHGINSPAFLRLSDAAKYAWAWRAFNEPALQELEYLPNVKLVIYEDLCLDPEAAAREIFDFVGLQWNEQTAAFLAASTRNPRTLKYFSVFRDSAAMANRWRSTLAADDQDAVRSTVRGLRLVRFWPDLSES